MTIILKQLLSLIQLLNSDTGAKSIAAGVVCGLILGFSPTLSLQALLIFIILFFFRIQLGAALGMALFFKLIAYLFDPICHKVGMSILEAESLKPLLTDLYNMPLIPMTRFNNSIVMGSGVVAVALSPFVYVLSLWLIAKYRETVVERFRKSKVWKALSATSLYQWYVKYEHLRHPG